MARNLLGGPSVSRNLIIVIGAVALSATAVATWLLGSRDGLLSGVGPYQAELDDCRDRLENGLQHPRLFEFIEDTIWRQGDAEDLLIAGKVRMLGGDGLPVVYEFECVLVDSHVLRADIS